MTDIRPGGPQKRTTPPGTGRDSAEPNPKRPTWMEKNEEVKNISAYQCFSGEIYMF